MGGDGRLALLFDYDGTLSPVDAPREKAYPSMELLRVLEGLAEKYIVGVVTSKDYWFMKGRAGFASVLGLVSGLEAVMGSFVFTVREAFEAGEVDLRGLWEKASGTGSLYVEEKKSISGSLLST
ncbi:trehalose-phosphatase [Desulfurococcus mucosus]|uniref:trehalose-phosphatase n=1 Tax=Desulfurococcus mucosus TaxID=2275 RepID=UPI00068A30DC|nr:trehalose-phosphatase [Desulfurococcus mucosus]